MVLIAARVSIRTVVILVALLVAASAYRIWMESRGTFVVGPDYFGSISPWGQRRVWPLSDIGRVEASRHPAAFGRETVYWITDRQGAPLMKMRPVLFRDGDLDGIFGMLGLHPSDDTMHNSAT